MAMYEHIMFRFVCDDNEEKRAEEKKTEEREREREREMYTCLRIRHDFGSTSNQYSRNELTTKVGNSLGNSLGYSLGNIDSVGGSVGGSRVFCGR